jgi:peptide chain release factor 3
VFFGTALQNDGIAELLDELVERVQPPAARLGEDGVERPLTSPFAGFVFKVQSNQDLRHRDRIAFVRVCSGAFTRGMRVKNARTGLALGTQYTHLVQARERSTADTAFPGDVIGVITTGDLVVGDTIYDGPTVRFPPIPTLAPEMLRTCYNSDSSKRKQFVQGLKALGEEGVVQMFEEAGRGKSPNPVLGAAGLLQYEVLTARMKTEYGVTIRLEAYPANLTRVTDAEGFEIAKEATGTRRLRRSDGKLFIAFDGPWHIAHAQRLHPDLKLDAIVR